MTQNVYRDKILEGYVKPYILEGGKHWVLEEDGDSGHGFGSDINIVARWKSANNLDYYKNAPRSPDLSPIETCWSPVKQNIRKMPRYDDSTLRTLIDEGWSSPHVTNKRLIVWCTRCLSACEM